MELTSDVLAKIAAMVLSSEEGATFVEGVLAKAAGAEAATETLQFLAQQSELAEKQAAYEQGQADAEALIQQAIYQAGIDAGKNEAVNAEKQSFFGKLGQAAADASIENLMAQGGGAGAMPPEAAAAGGEEEGISEEELQSGLQQLVEEGTLTPEDAQAVMEYIAQAEGGGEAPAAADAGEAAQAAGSDAAGADQEAEEEPSKEGTAKKASDLLETIKQIRQSREQK